MAVAAVLGAAVALLSSRGQSHPAAALPKVVKVVIPEGSTRLQIARIAAHDGLTGSYLDASRTSPQLQPATFGAPAGTPNLEGFLFPATYEIYVGDSVSRLVEDQLIAFSEKVGHAEDALAGALHLTPYQLLIIASLIEREARVPGDRPKIAAVILNRLRLGMPIGVDASIYYALEVARGEPTLTGELTGSDLRIDSPYNTRTHKGLPPTPIANPGLASLYAAAHPAHVPVPVLRGRRGRLRRARVLRQRGPVRSRRRRLPGRRRRQRRPAPGVQTHVSVRLGVLGWPVAHSRSPAMQNAALADLGLDEWRYQRLPVPPELFAEHRPRASGGGLPRRQRHDPPQAGGACAGEQRQRRGPRDRGGEHADLHPGGRDRG